MKKILLGLFIVFIFTGCAPKIGELTSMSEVKSENSAEIFIIRNYNFIGSGIRLYPTINDKKLAGLYTNNHIHFYLEEGNYTFGIEYPDVLFGRWMKGNIIKKMIDANKQYYFLLSPNHIVLMNGIMEIEEISQSSAKNRLNSSTLISTGNLSDKPDIFVKVIKPVADLMGLDEDDEKK